MGEVDELSYDTFLELVLIVYDEKQAELASQGNIIFLASAASQGSKPAQKQLEKLSKGSERKTQKPTKKRVAIPIREVLGLA